MTPTADILSPVAGSYAHSTPVVFQGTAFDPEDGFLAGAALVWNSSSQGFLGTGSTFTRRNLLDGTHTITLTATDSKGASGAKSVVIEIEEDEPPGIALALSNSDGFLDAIGSFQSARGGFSPGDGGPGKPDSLVYELVVGNESDVTATGVIVDDVLAPNSNVIRWLQTLFSSQGTVVSADDDGFTWNIGTLAPHTFASLRFRAEALQLGNAVNRVSLTADQHQRAIVNEELTSIGGREVGLSNSDGFLDAAGIFQSAREVFSVGDGKVGTDSLVFEVLVVNESASTATGLRIVDLVAPHTGIMAWRETLFISSGSITEAASGGFTWNIGNLVPRMAAVLRFRAEALDEGDDVNRILLSFDQLDGVAILLEEPVHIE